MNGGCCQWWRAQSESRLSQPWEPFFSFTTGAILWSQGFTSHQQDCGQSDVSSTCWDSLKGTWLTVNCHVSALKRANRFRRKSFPSSVTYFSCLPRSKARVSERAGTWSKPVNELANDRERKRERERGRERERERESGRERQGIRLIWPPLGSQIWQMLSA